MRLIPLATALALTFGAMSPAPAVAQGLFTARAYVNGAAITEFELRQRMLFMQQLGAGGLTERQAMEALIDDRLYLIAGRIQKVSVTDDQLRTGMREFAERGQLTVEQLTQRLAGVGVSEETFREFVRAGLIWREVVRTRFGGRVTVTEADIDRALQVESIRPEREILLSEIILPTVAPYAEQSRQIADLIRENVHNSNDFAEAASRFSASQSREQGGRLEWIREANMPPQIREVLDGMRPGQMSREVQVPNAIAIFFLRERRDTPRPAPAATTLDYAEVLLANGHAPETVEEAAKLRARVDSCDDLYAALRGAPAAVQRHSASPGQLPADVAMELARLDQNETSTSLVQGDSLRVLMLCSRTLTQAEPPNRDQVRTQLLNQRAGKLADNYLAELRANAIIRGQ
ncbi:MULTISPECIES: peptidylprolyl isomerase [Haematobacter]|uniref:Parvulin-like PPIase n=1 Tax=Haematobacter genomosp. 1 TaxID=366618 RepID=A0A212AGP3_9RHOB|nr:MULTISPECIES: peptidylprolyl isomerase [Haematobacter]OWJ80593.1 peptidylprolyl isomerase [Haematobacter genomosp. 1]